ncbi:hypothetical protein CR159_18560 [Pollutimonas subterranea]|uniref:Uncharacterized protein n=1 Tax=Pollutimonas subterranea TaxID=2045210 RepID=A0A2N4U071_9BURK|nr:hypothetical protein CR159_18560 [Pollutimonas subterranea]
MRIVASFEALQPVRLKIRTLLDLRDLPDSGTRVLGYQPQDLLDLLLRELGWLPRTWQIIQPGKALLLIAITLFKDDWRRDSKAFTDLAGRLCRIQLQQDPRTLRKALIQGAFAKPPWKFRAVQGRQSENSSRFTHGRHPIKMDITHFYFKPFYK